MGEKTGISWCDHTFNPWWGCTKVSPGCDHCYAEKMATRWGFDKLWSRCVLRTFGMDHWNEPLKWNREAEKKGKIERVFCGSMCDIFEQRRSSDLDTYRARVFDLIKLTPNLEWLLLTKRPENIGEMISQSYSIRQTTNIRIGTTVENQNILEERMTNLLRNWQGKNFVSIEPMLSDVYIYPWLVESPEDTSSFGLEPWQTIDWVICGCESGSNARPCNTEWVRSLRNQCQESGTPFFLKQMVEDGKLVKEPYLDGRQWLEFPIGKIRD